MFPNQTPVETRSITRLRCPFNSSTKLTVRDGLFVFFFIVQSHQQLRATAIAYLHCGKKILAVVWAFYPSILSSGSPFILLHFSFSFFLFNLFGVKQYLWTYLWHQSLARQTGVAASDRPVRLSWFIVKEKYRIFYLISRLISSSEQVTFRSEHYSI